MTKKPKKRKGLKTTVRHEKPMTETELKAWADRYVKLVADLKPEGGK